MYATHDRQNKRKALSEQFYPSRGGWFVLTSTPKMPMRKLLLLLSAVLGIDLVLSLLFVSLAQVLVPSDVPVNNVDGIVVFHAGGDLDGLDRESIRRMEKARALYAMSKPKGVFCAGGARQSQGYFGCEMIIQAMIERGVPADVTDFDKHSNDTRSNLNEALGWVAAQNWQRVIFVSDAMHLLRIRYLVEEFASRPQISFISYGYAVVSGVAEYLHIWYRVHYELLAWAAHAIFPTSLYRDILDIIRGPYNR